MTVQHGQESCHSNGCRRPECVAAHTEGSRRRRRLRAYGQWQPTTVEAVGAHRRVQALACLGWSQRALSTKLGWHADRLVILMGQQRISTTNHARIAALYDELWCTQAPRGSKGERISFTRAVSRAEREGWPRPMAWDDDDLDDPDAVPQNPAGSSSWDQLPCGTTAAARRHYRRGEPLDEACRNADRRARTERKKAA